MNKEQITQYLIEQLEMYGALPDNLEQFNFVNEGFVDSLSIMKFLVLVEAHFEIQLDESVLLNEQFGNIMYLTDIIAELKNQ